MGINSIHRIVAGSPACRRELIAAGLFACAWFVMDAVQWVDWLVSKLSPAAVVCLK